jgi:hypothetical protein
MKNNNYLMINIKFSDGRAAHHADSWQEDVHVSHGTGACNTYYLAFSSRSPWRLERNPKIGKKPAVIAGLSLVICHLHSYIKIPDRCSRAIERIRFSSGIFS